MDRIIEGDNLLTMQTMSDATVDFCYCDPPFHSSRQYTKADRGFCDKFASIDEYLAFMEPRLREIHRILKPTGSMVVHCDWHADSYLRVICDRLFGEKNFRCPIIWRRTSHPHFLSSTLDILTDTLLYYTKSDQFTCHPQYRNRTADDFRAEFPHYDPRNRRWFNHASLESAQNSSNKHEPRVIQGRTVYTNLGWKWTQQTLDEEVTRDPHLIYWTKNGRPRYKIWADQHGGIRIGNLWTDIPEVTSTSDEDEGYPTQKPSALLRRMIGMCTNEGDILLDPFCGSGTACVIAKEMRRHFVGMDINPDAVHVGKKRLHAVGHVRDIRSFL